MCNIKNCPFCGGVPELTSYPKSWYNYNTDIACVTEWQVSIHCTGCRLFFGSTFEKVEWAGGNGLAHQKAIQRIIERWNKRV